MAAKKSKFDVKNLADHRKAQRKTQTEFWGRFGVTQSGSSRYEAGRRLPQPLAMLMWLHQNGHISEQPLESARKAVKLRPRPTDA